MSKSEQFSIENAQPSVPELLVNKRLNRRSFLATAGALGVAGAAGCGGGSGSSKPPVATAPPTPSAVDVLNFALNLEYLEATFYLTLATGKGLQAADMGSAPGAVTGGIGQITFAMPGLQDILNQLAADEQAHVQFLRATLQKLGATPVDMPALNLAALGPVTNDAQFLAIARALETTGTSAYEGGVTFLTSNPAALTYAAQVHDTEGQHESLLRGFCINANVVSPAVDANDYVPVTAPKSGSTSYTYKFFNTNPSNGLYTLRSPQQVLQIVYGTTSTGVTSGGFFPSGVNGSIKST